MKLKLEKRYVIEVIVWIALVGLTIFCVSFIFHKKFVEPNLYAIAFSDVDGLIQGSPVKMMGVTVGHVRNFTYQKEFVDVQIIVTKKNVKIPKGSFARVEFSGIAGSKSIELMPPVDELNDIAIVSKDTLRLSHLFASSKWMLKAFYAMEQFTDKISTNSITNAFQAGADAINKVKEADDAVEKAKMDAQELKRLSHKVNRLDDAINQKANFLEPSKRNKVQYKK